MGELGTKTGVIQEKSGENANWGETLQTYDRLTYTRKRERKSDDWFYDWRISNELGRHMGLSSFGN